MVRGYRADAVDDLDALLSSDFFANATADGRLVGSERIDVPEAIAGDWAAALQHERLGLISFPYEWSFSMLQDAALLQLRLARDALADGLICKDATPYNVQFVGSKPVFIDVGSFERLQPGQPWVGYQQFCELFLNPLLLQARTNVSFQPWLRGSVGGISPQDLAPLLSRRNRWRRGTFTHVTLHARAQRRHAANDRDVQGEMRRAGFGPAIIDAQLKNLTKSVERLRWKQSDSTWSGYSERGHYSDTDLELKEAFVAEVCSRAPRQLVVDLGANDGHFSRIAARSADAVIAVDADDLVTDRLYRTLRSEGNEQILPLTMDLVDSSPSLGWRGRERPAFFERTRPDVVLALAVVHHMAIPGTVPPPEIVDWLADMGAELVLEVPHADDPMVEALIRRKRAGVFAHYGLEAFETRLRERMDVRRNDLLPGGTRTLFHAVPPLLIHPSRRLDAHDDSMTQEPNHQVPSSDRHGHHPCPPPSPPAARRVLVAHPAGRSVR